MNSKFLMLFAITAITFSSCEKMDQPFSYENINANLDKYITEKSYTVNVPDGAIAVVTMGENSTDTLSVTSTTKDIIVPKYITPSVNYVYSKSQSLKSIRKTTSNTEDVNLYNNLYEKQKDSYWQVIAFEDSKNGDYDYNDLIVHNKYVLENGKLSIYIHPVALGAQKTINFGYELYKKSKSGYSLVSSDIINDVRKNLFVGKDESGFINTESYQRHYDGYTYGKTFDNCYGSLSDYCIVSYITTNDNTEKIYALNKENAKNTDLFDKNGMPYALVLHGVSKNGYKQNVNGKSIPVGYDWFKYPMERVNINNCYDIQKWLQSESPLEDYIIKDAKVFPINEASRYSSDGITKVRIYELPKPFNRVTEWQ